MRRWCYQCKVQGKGLVHVVNLDLFGHERSRSVHLLSQFRQSR